MTGFLQGAPTILHLVVLAKIVGHSLPCVTIACMRMFIFQPSASCLSGLRAIQLLCCI